MTPKPTVRSKTFWAGLATIVTGVGLILNGDIATGAQTITAGILAVFLRDAISTSR